MKSADNNAYCCTRNKKMPFTALRIKHKKKGHINAYMFALCPIQDQEDILRLNKSASFMCTK